MPLQDKSTESVARGLVDRVFYPFDIPKRILSDNGTEFKNELLQEICSQYKISQSFTSSYHPQGNGLIERTNRKILEVLRPLVLGLHSEWEDWIPQVQASINNSINSATNKTPHYIMFGQDKRLPYDILTETRYPLYNVEDYSKLQAHKFQDIYQQVRQRMQASRAEIIAKQHRRARPLSLQVGDSVMKRVPERGSKLDPKFEGPFIIVGKQQNKFRIRGQSDEEVVHGERLKKLQRGKSSRRKETPQTRTRSRPPTRRRASAFHMKLRQRPGERK